MTFAIGSMLSSRHKFFALAFCLAFSVFYSTPLRAQRSAATATIPKSTLIQIVRAEDERRWDAVLSDLMSHEHAAVRTRAALAAGRIGNELAVPALVSLLQDDKDQSVRSMAVFALGEIESANAVEPLTAQLSTGPRGRIVEALGKIAAALPQTNEAEKKEVGKTILEILSLEAKRRSSPDTEVILFALTAALRARPEGAGAVVAQFLVHSEPRIRADAGNTLARLRAKDGNEELRKLLTRDADPNVRANAARVLGATEDKSAFNGLLDRALNDPDVRVRVSAIRAIGTLKDSRATTHLLQRGTALTARREMNEILEIVTTLGRIEQNSKSQSTIAWLEQLKGEAPEVDIALARVAPQLYSAELQRTPAAEDWHRFAAMAQGAGELANVKSGDPLLDASIKSEALKSITSGLSCPREKPPRSTLSPGINAGMVVGVSCGPIPAKAVPDWLRAYAAFQPGDLAELLRKHLNESDVIIRTTAAELLGELKAEPANTEALRKALIDALRDKDSNDAALAILDALAKYKDPSANQAIKAVMNSNDYLVQRKAVDSLKANGAGDFSKRLRPIKSKNAARDYQRALSRIGKRVVAVVNTTKGRFTIELLPEDAPLNVDNFVQLAKRGYFNKIVFHRVVPNFVIQGGDPRGDGNGGPGYQIRCEINEVPYDRGAVGMALSGKDTGGSQWFVTHAPQPHLDGGYTVFGRVAAGMDVVDRISRGDVISSILVTEKPTRRNPSRGR